MRIKGQSKDIKNRGSVRPVLLAVLVGFAALFSITFLLSNNASSQKEVVPNLAVAPLPAVPERYDIKISGNDTFYSIMRLFELSPTEIYKITRSVRPVYNLAGLKKGAMLSVFTLNGSIDRVLYRLNDFESLVIKKNDKAKSGYGAARLKLPTEARLERASGEIENSLYEAARNAGVDPGLILNLSDIFAWDVDFATDIRKGDRFSILYEKIYVEGRPVTTGRILGGEIINAGRTYRAFYFKNKRGGRGYFDEKGRSLRRMLLKSPLRYSRISSYFTNRRYHPILKRYRPHHGIDYAAPRGTPVDAAGSGRVVFAGWKRGYGRFIVIKHNHGFKTAYGHLSRIKKGIRRGARVEQGQVIGYVGSSGISTGPHLHYEVRKGKRLLNPLNIRSNPARSVPKGEMPEFILARDNTLERLTGSTVVMTAKQ